eukprot:contig_19022_g4700
MSLYTILGALQRQWFTLSMGDIATFAEWWSVFELFLAQFFEVEDQVLFPWLTESAPTSRPLHRYFKQVRYTKEKMLGMYYDVGQTFELFNTRAPSEVLGKLYQALIAFLPALLSYLETQEAVLPPIIREHCEVVDRLLVNRAMANFWLRAAAPRDGIVMLTRWMSDESLLQRWLVDNLSPRARSSYRKWRKRFEER